MYLKRYILFFSKSILIQHSNAICTIKEFLVAAIISSTHTGAEVMNFKHNSNADDGEQNPQSPFCVRMHSGKVNKKLQ